MKRRRPRWVLFVALSAVIAFVLVHGSGGGGSSPRRTIARHGAAVVFAGSVLGLGLALRRLRARAELERAEAELASEFESLDSGRR
jgi:hypothetical protein